MTVMILTPNYLPNNSFYLKLALFFNMLVIKATFKFILNQLISIHIGTLACFEWSDMFVMLTYGILAYMTEALYLAINIKHLLATIKSVTSVTYIIT